MGVGLIPGVDGVEVEGEEVGQMTPRHHTTTTPLRTQNSPHHEPELPQQPNKAGDLVSGAEFSVAALRAIWRAIENRISRIGTQGGLVVVISRIMAAVGGTTGTATEKGVRDGVEDQRRDRPGHRVHRFRLRGTKAPALAQPVGDNSQ